MPRLPVSWGPSRRVLTVFILVVLVVLAGCSGLGGSESAEETGKEGGGGGDDGGSESGPSGGDDGPGGVGSYYDADGDHVVVRSATMDVRVKNFEQSFRSVRQVTNEHGGYLGDRSQNTEGEWDTGTVILKVPAENFSTVRDAIEDLGRVESVEVTALDFTREYQDRQGRIAELESDESNLERLLNETDNASEARRIRSDLEEIRSDLDTLRSDQQALRERGSMSTLEVTLHEPESKKPPRSYETAFGFFDAFRDAFYGGLTAIKYVIVFFGYAIPIGIALLLAGVFMVALYAVYVRTRQAVSEFLGVDLTGTSRQRQRRRGERWTEGKRRETTESSDTATSEADGPADAASEEIED